ncbi:molybdenum cofactor guanylyltransferase [Candidatus Thorarchaeota archaeon]|nr:MAG: molybdenum cofactor guanylyltransferase [Candidatus Thorarchaeota archaeon]
MSEMDESDLTVAVLAGGNSSRFKTDKAFAPFNGRPLVEHMMGIASQISPNLLLVLSAGQEAAKFSEIVGEARVVRDPEDSVKSALTGAVTAFEFAETQYTLLLPVDTPLASPVLLRMLADLAPRHGAVVPSWPSGYIEPLHAVYLSEHAYAHGLHVLESGKYRMRNLLDALRNVLFVSTMVLEQFDSELNTFRNINTLEQLQELETIARKRF